MIVYPNCKINLGLYVTSKRPDGYHNIETIFLPVLGLHDELEITPLDEGCSNTFIQKGITVDCAANDNLIMKVVRMYQERYQIGPVQINFTKNIPFGAGLGGGSSDAAHTAIALNKIFNLGLSLETLKNDVKTLGADCPFFIENRPCFAEGIGDILTPVSIDLSNYKLALIKPNINVSTKTAYAGITPKTANFNLRNLEGKELNKFLLKAISNDFETTVFAVHPELQIIKKKLYSLGADYAAMSGSGSTLFGLFKDLSALERYAESGTNPHLRLLHKDASLMVFLDNSFCETQS